MSWLDRAEAKYGHLAISGLPRIIVGFNALVYALYLINPKYLAFLDLRPALVKDGQIWRLVTYLFIPNLGSIIPLPEIAVLILYLLFINFVGMGLERALGAFKLNVYYLLGMLGLTATAFLLGPAGQPVLGSSASVILNSSLFFAFARFYPELILYMFFILPVKVKWMAWFGCAYTMYIFVLARTELRLSILVCLVNYIAFFGAEHVREARHRTTVASRRQRFEDDMRHAQAGTLHECAICKKTENSDPYLDFRVARDGKEYCTEHLPKADPTALSEKV